MHIGNIEINNVEVEVHCDARSGMFTIYDLQDEGDTGPVGPSLGIGTTLDAARNAARISLNKRKIKVSVQFITTSGEHGIAHSLHARNRKVLCVMADGSKDQFDTYHKVFKPDIPPELLSRYIDLENERDRIRRDIADIENTWQFPLGSVVQKKIEDAVAE